MLSTLIDPFSSQNPPSLPNCPLTSNLPQNHSPASSRPRPELYLARSPSPSFLIYQLPILHILTAVLIFVSGVEETLVQKNYREATFSLDIPTRRPGWG